MKKFLSLVLALVMTMSLVTVSAGAKDFTDNDAITYEEAVAVMSEIGVIDGYTTGDFKPTATLTRGAAAKIICNLILGPTTASALAATTAPFSDVAADSTFAGYIAYLAKEGIIGGYADGTFKPGNSLTGYAFLKMLLGALGYDADIEGYNGANYAVSVAKQAIEAGLTKGLVSDFDGRTAVTREEACLYAFNTLQAIMVEYDNRIVVGEGATAVAISGVRKDLTWNKGVKNDGNIEEDGFVQFAEQYFPKLVKRADVDAFDRPSYTWVNNKDEIGTYVNWSLMVAEYTTGVSGQDLADVIGKTVIAKSDVEYYVDGVADDTIKATNMVKANTNDYATTGNGILTQVFVDTDNNAITVTSINTFAAKVTSDYNTKKESLSIDVQDNSAYTYTTETLSSDDFAGLEDYEDGDVILVTVAETAKGKMTVQTIADPEVLTDKDVTKFKEDTYLVTDGTQYDYNELGYIWNDLGDYYGDKLDDTYNIYLDTYGYVIATEKATGTSKYLFMTGYDLGGSYLATKKADAFAIFTDGTTANIKVDVKETNTNIGSTANYAKLDGGDNQYNRWFKYSVDKDDVYTLTPVDKYNFMYAKDYVDYSNDGTQKMNVNNVRIVDERSGSCPVTKKATKIAYGNDDSVFITVKTGDVSLTTQDATLLGITKVTGTYTGVQNVDLKISNSTDNKLSVDIKDAKQPAVYALYDSDLYIIAAIVVGEDNTTSDSYAYAIKNTKNEYKDSEGNYFWEFDAIVDGKIVTLTVKEKGTKVLQGKISKALDMDDYSMFKLTYDKEGYVIDAEHIDTVKVGNDQKLYDVEDFRAKTIVDGSDYKIYDVYHSVAANLYAVGRTLYVNNKADLDVGLTIAADAPVVVIEEYTTGTKYEEYDTIKQALDALDDSSKFTGHIAAALNSNGTAKYLVLKSTTLVVEDVNGGESNVTTDVNSVKLEGNGDVSLYDKKGAAITTPNVKREAELYRYAAGQDNYVCVYTGEYVYGDQNPWTLNQGDSYYVVIDGVKSNITIAQ